MVKLPINKVKLFKIKIIILIIVVVFAYSSQSQQQKQQYQNIQDTTKISTRILKSTEKTYYIPNNANEIREIVEDHMYNGRINDLLVFLDIIEEKYGDLLIDNNLPSLYNYKGIYVILYVFIFFILSLFDHPV